jgi:hypothetical protein
VRQCQRSGVDPGVGRLRLEHARDDALLLQRERAHRADRAGADDEDVARAFMLPSVLQGAQPFIHASISATVLGGVVSTSQPVSVTATSSSMRMPMFHKASGTPSAGRMYRPG